MQGENCFKFPNTVLRSLYDDAGHLGVDKTYGFVKDRFNWPKMTVDVGKYCQSCTWCVQRKILPKKVAPLSHLSSNGHSVYGLSFH